LNNAAKYGKAGGWIGVSGEVVQTGKATEVRLTVRDHGPGIEPDERRHIFEPFYRGAKVREAQVPGTGLGLNLVHQMMEAMGGRVTVQTEQGKGSSFTLHLAAAAMEVKHT